MSVTFTKEADDLFVIRVEGVLTFEDLKDVEKRARDEFDRDLKTKLLVLAERFSGWGKEGDWGDMSFMYEYDPYIAKIAVVANEQHKDKILMFIGAGRRKASVEFFFPDEEQDAREWLLKEDQ